jgi:hypothetical protein
MELLIIVVLLVTAAGGYLTGIAGTLEKRRKDISGRYTVNTTDDVLVIPLDTNGGRGAAWHYAKTLLESEGRNELMEKLEDL